MPWWVLNFTTFPAFNLGFSVMFWAMMLILPLLILLFLIKKI